MRQNSMRYHLMLLCLAFSFALLGNSSGARASAVIECVHLFSSSSEESRRVDVGVAMRKETREAKGMREAKRVPKDMTNNLKAYLAQLLEQREIGDSELVRFIEGLKEGQLVNPISEREALESSASLIHRDGIQEYINQSDINGIYLNQQELLEWSEKSLKERERVRVQRKEVRKETERIYGRMEFHPVPPGSFKMGNKDGEQVLVKLTHRIEVMSKPVTQAQWAEVMEDNPSYFVEGEDSVVINLNGKSIRMQPDHPVESVTFWSAFVFANRLSEKDGFKPVYDLSGIEWKQGTRAENGTLMPKNEEETGNNILAREFYGAEGYRLPAQAEQEYILRAAGTSEGKYHFGDNEVDLEKYAWYDKNSDGQTHPVGELLPLIIDGNAFYDLHGNVWEWGQDLYKSNKPLPGGTNPLVDISSYSGRVIGGGGSWHSNANDARSAYRNGWWPNGRYYSYGYVGIRLVRTLQ